jgi:osmotically inducible lipoprotein OsmB
MKAMSKLTVKTTLAIAAIVALSACGTMSVRDRNTVLGTGIGAVGGAVLTNGSPWGTVGGAAVGGVVGNHIH